MKGQLNRREFIKTTSVITGGLILGAPSINAASYSRIVGANSRINFAVAGLRSRGQAHRDAIKYCENSALTHICEVDKRYEQEFSAKVKEDFGYAPVAINDYRKLVEDKDIDVITIATFQKSFFWSCCLIRP